MEIVVAGLVLGISALAFVAYNHPRQFAYVGYACIAWLLLSHLAIVIVNRVDSTNLSIVKKSGIPPEHIETVVKALTNISAPDWLNVLGPVVS